MGDERIELEASVGGHFSATPDRRVRMDEPLPVRLVAVADVRALGRTGLEGDLHRFYVGMWGFEPVLAGEGGLGFRADNFRLILEMREGLIEREDLRPIGVEIRSLAEAEQKIIDAELEYQDVEDSSVYVEFPAVDPQRVHEAFSGGMGKSHAKVSFLVWTTTPWTLPANLAIAFGPEVEYALVAYGDRAVVVAADLVEAVFKLRPGTAHDVVTTVRGEALLGLEYRHPFADRVGRLVQADYVTTTDGTGLVHTAPGHGEEDFSVIAHDR